jgi:hypothetical protein
MKTLLATTLAMLLASGSAAQELLPVRGRSTAELLALKVSDFSTTMTTTRGELEIRTKELAELERKQALPKGPQADKELPGSMWTAMLFNTRLDIARDIFKLNLHTLHEKPVAYQQYFLYAAYATIVLDGETDPELLQGLVQLLKNHGSKLADREYAIAAYAILKGSRAREEDPEVLKQRFLDPLISAVRGTRALPPDQATTSMYDPRMEALLDELEKSRAERVKDRPPLVDLLAWEFPTKVPVAFSLQRVNRQHPGMVIVRGADGKFVRREDGGFFSLPHLANARTDLPGTITNGNTPQGLFTIVGTGKAQNKWIGPTPYLASQIPYEASVADFRHVASDEQWSIDLYKQFLPPSWRDYKPMQEAWLAGRAGRSEMLCHGTTISSEYYVGEPYYPFTPSAGCLVMVEEWDKETGVLTRSDQLTLAQTFVKAGGPRGYLVVVELDAKEQPVTLPEVNGEIAYAEKRLAGQ